MLRNLKNSNFYAVLEYEIDSEYSNDEDYEHLSGNDWEIVVSNYRRDMNQVFIMFRGYQIKGCYRGSDVW